MMRALASVREFGRLTFDSIDILLHYRGFEAFQEGQKVGVYVWTKLRIS
jgi:hypothetical protein